MNRDLMKLAAILTSLEKAVIMNAPTPSLVLVALLAASVCSSVTRAATLADPSSGPTTDVFVSGKDVYPKIRIPAIVTTGQGTLLDRLARRHHRPALRARRRPGDQFLPDHARLAN